jgi:hypothetical protein
MQWPGLNLRLCGETPKTNRQTQGKALFDVDVLLVHTAEFVSVSVFFDHSTNLVYVFCLCSCVFVLRPFKLGTNATCSKSS